MATSYFIRFRDLRSPLGRLYKIVKSKSELNKLYKELLEDEYVMDIYIEKIEEKVNW